MGAESNMRSLSSLFQKQISLQFSLQLEKFNGEKADQVTVDQADDISSFYLEACRQDLASEETIRSFFSKGYSFWAVWEHNKIVSGIWAFSGDLSLKNPSFIVLSDKIGNTIRLNEGCIYVGYIFTLTPYRGKGYCERIMRTIFDYYNKKNFSTCILTTGPENIGMIKVINKFEHQIDGIFEVYKALRLYKKRLVFRNSNKYFCIM